MADFVNFEAVEDANIDEIGDDDDDNGQMSENVSDIDFIDDQNDFDENIEDYHGFTNASRSYEDAM